MDHCAACVSVFCDQGDFRNDEINDARRYGRLLYAAAFALRLLCVCFFRDRAALEFRLRLFRVQVASRATHTGLYRAAYGRGQAYPSPKIAA